MGTPHRSHVDGVLVPSTILLYIPTPGAYSLGPVVTSFALTCPSNLQPVLGGLPFPEIATIYLMRKLVVGMTRYVFVEWMNLVIIIRSRRHTFPIHIIFLPFDPHFRRDDSK
jgi:hypothetical protein